MMGDHPAPEVARGLVASGNVLLAVLATLLVGSANADDEAANAPRVFASRHGNCYAKSVPLDASGDRGVTTVFRVEAQADTPLARYPWYASELYLECNVGAAGEPVATAVARVGSPLRGRAANANDLALAFYRGGRLLQRHSTLDIAGTPGNVKASVSHYRVLERIDGYRWLSGDAYRFDAVATDGRRLSFDAATGQLVSAEAGPPGPIR